MQKKLNLLIVSVLATIGVFVYLTVHHYSLKLGLGGTSLCQISSAVNCDAAATSSFAELFGIPVAIWGAVFQSILLIFLVFYRLGFSEGTPQLRFTVRSMLAAAVVVSVVMGIISLVWIKVICPACLLTYVFSIINLALGWNAIDAEGKLELSSYTNQYKSHLIALACVPLFSWTASGMIESNYGLDQLKKMIPEYLAYWQASPTNNFNNEIGLSNKVANPKATIVEFADFKCPHCKTASNNIDSYLKGKSDILLIYKPFPLDGQCNSDMQQKGDGSRCGFAAFALCAEKLAQKGWDVHHWLFENQETFFDVSDAKKLLPEIETKFGIAADKMSECADSSVTYDEIRKSTEEGKAAGVEGTPTVYINGKKLKNGHILEILKSAIGTL